MKVVLVDPSLFTLPYDRELAAGLRAGGHQVTLYGTPMPDQGVGPGDDGQAVVPHFYRRLSGLPSLPKAVQRVAKGFSHGLDMRAFCTAMEQARPDVIHFQWLPLPLLDRLFLARLRRIAPLVLTVHDTTPFNGSPGSSLQALGALAVLREFDGLIVHTAQGCRTIAGHTAGPARIRVIPHGLLHQADLTRDPVDGAQPSGDDGPGHVRFLLFGKIKPYKGVDVLLHALALLPAEARRRCRVRVVGKPYMDVAPLEALADRLGVADAIGFEWRFIADSELTRLFHESDVLLFPYRQIEASGVLMTAIAVGKPVIATRMGAAAELFAQGDGGILIAADRADELAAAMRRFIDVPGSVASGAAHVRQLRDAIPSWVEIGRLTAQAYQSAAAASGRETAPADRPEGTLPDSGREAAKP